MYPGGGGISEGHFTSKESRRPLRNILLFKKSPSKVRINALVLTKYRTLFPMSEVLLGYFTVNSYGGVYCKDFCYDSSKKCSPLLIPNPRNPRILKSNKNNSTSRIEGWGRGFWSQVTIGNGICPSHLMKGRKRKSFHKTRGAHTLFRVRACAANVGGFFSRNSLNKGPFFGRFSINMVDYPEIGEK